MHFSWLVPSKNSFEEFVLAYRDTDKARFKMTSEEHGYRACQMGGKITVKLRC